MCICASFLLTRMFKNYCGELLANIDKIINSASTETEKQNLNKLKSYISILIYLKDGNNSQNVCKNLMKLSFDLQE